MPLATSAATDALAHTLASLRGLTPDEVVAGALRAELERERQLHPTASADDDPTVEEVLGWIHSTGPWNGQSSKELVDELYDKHGLPR
jgi:hypothetical protein